MSERNGRHSERHQKVEPAKFNRLADEAARGSYTASYNSQVIFYRWLAAMLEQEARKAIGRGAVEAGYVEQPLAEQWSKPISTPPAAPADTMPNQQISYDDSLEAQLAASQVDALPPQEQRYYDSPDIQQQELLNNSRVTALDEARPASETAENMQRGGLVGA
jgi:hypothetical protein